MTDVIGKPTFISLYKKCASLSTINRVIFNDEGVAHFLNKIEFVYLPLYTIPLLYEHFVNKV